MDVISAQKLVRASIKKEALSDVSFSIPKGEIGFLDPSGFSKNDANKNFNSTATANGRYKQRCLVS